MAFKPTSAQKDEIRRLTQLANRRIKAAERQYRKAGQDIIPREIAGDYQIREKWATESTPISRSVRFDTEEQYRKKMKELKRFEKERPGIKAFTQTERQKTQLAVQDVIGDEVPAEIMNKIDRMSGPELTEFWNKFEEKATRLGLQFSSDQVIIETMGELFSEDIQGMATPLPAQR